MSWIKPDASWCPIFNMNVKYLFPFGRRTHFIKRLVCHHFWDKHVFSIQRMMTIKISFCWISALKCNTFYHKLQKDCHEWYLMLAGASFLTWMTYIYSYLRAERISSKDMYVIIFETNMSFQFKEWWPLKVTILVPASKASRNSALQLCKQEPKANRQTRMVELVFSTVHCGE